VSSPSARPWPPGAETPGASGFELVMQALPQRRLREDQLAAMRDGAEQRLNRRVDHRSSGALACQPHQRRAVTVIGLKPPCPELRPRRARL
jgi:hypothetical protein